MTAIFPSLIGVGFPARRTPIWDTDVQRSISGKTTGLGRYSFPLWKYELPFNVLRSGAQLELQTLAAFYNSVNGRAQIFQFTDPDDGTLAADQGLGTGDGATTTFQLVRAMTGNGVAFVEPVFAPTGSQTIKVNGVVVSNYTIGSDANGAPGNVIFNTAPANAATITWAAGGTFNWWCRFDEDSADFEKFKSTLWRLGKITFTTEKF